MWNVGGCVSKGKIAKKDVLEIKHVNDLLYVTFLVSLWQIHVATYIIYCAYTLSIVIVYKCV